VARRGEPLELSVVVPLFNEEECVRPLVDAVESALEGVDRWELVLVDDGSSDATAAIVQDLTLSRPRIRLVRLARNYGQTAAMQAGFDQARGSVVVSMDGDLQNDPRDIPRLVGKLNEGYDLVAGYRERRQDKLLTRKVPSWIANRIIRRITGLSIRDNGCSLKAYRRSMLDRIRLYSDMHRFIPAVAAGMAGARITEVPVRHHPRIYGKSKYGLSRVLKVLADLLVIRMIRYSRERPLAMFSTAGIVVGAAGLVFGSAALGHRAVTGGENASWLVLPGSALLLFGLACYLSRVGRRRRRRRPRSAGQRAVSAARRCRARSLRAACSRRSRPRG
jgi:glycosyltransferase involved in cell wall biosynthesis